MAKIGAVDFMWLEFGKKGEFLSADAPLAVSQFSAPKKNVLVVSHGWKTNQDSAWKSYESLWRALEPLLPNATDWGVVGISWPSKKYDTAIDNAPAPAADAGGAAAFGGGGELADLPEAALNTRILEFANFVGASPASLLAASAKLVSDGLSTHTAIGVLSAIDAMIGYSRPRDSELAQDVMPFLSPDPTLPFYEAMSPPEFLDPANTQIAAGLGGSLKNGFHGVRAAASRILEQLTFWEMKKRAGRVGATLGEQGIASAIASSQTRVHLVGHSFGGRVVTAAASALPHGAKADSVIIMQGAFSHHGVTPGFKPGHNGAFANVTSAPKAKRIVTTHTHNDRACTVAYPVACRLSGDVANSIGDAKDEFGAMGANGTVGLPTSVAAALRADVNGTVQVDGAKLVWNVDASAFVKGHTDVWDAQMARLISQVVD